MKKTGAQISEDVCALYVRRVAVLDNSIRNVRGGTMDTHKGGGMLWLSF
ncbi:MAG: hypothetical protein WBC36_16705 [Desulfobacterales bacterium]|jgi:hypothetical protein